MIKNISLKHTKTTVFVCLNELDRLDIYDSNLEYLDNIMKYYLDLHDGIDELEYIREDYYLLLINISKIYKLINKSIYYLNKWFECNNTLYREVLLINNSRGYFINDLVTLFKDNYYNFKDKLNSYNLRYKLYNYDYYLLFCLLGKLNKIKFSTDVDHNIKNIKELIYYVDNTLILLDEYKEY